MTSVRQVGVPLVGELDRYLIGQGRHERLWTVLGAHPRDGGVAFAVWAPKAQQVHVIGDFDGRAMHPLGDSGIWATFVPAAAEGHRYKYRILGCDGVWRDKADPLAALAEVPPGNASVVFQSHHHWQDDDWMTSRPRREPHREPMSIYELHLGSWRPGLSYQDLSEQLPGYVADLGFTHVEFLPVMEHPYGGSWGYQVSGYYAPTARFGDPDGFRLLVDRLHQAGIGVILDWVPAHFPRDEWALARFDGGSLYEHGDPRRGEHPDWGTNVFDFGRSEVRNFLVANALYWCEEFHVDGLRVDAVASMLYLDYSRHDGQWYPNQHGGRENLEAISFLQELNATVYRTHPGVVMIAEESTAWPGVTRPTDQRGLGFGFKWNMGCVHDMFAYVGREPAWRPNLHNQMTFASSYAWSENYLLAISHDDVVHGKSPLTGKVPGDRWQRLATVRALLGFMWAHPGKQLLFMGCELAEDREWNDVRGLDWHLPEDSDRAGMQRLVRDLNGVYRREPALWSQDDVPAGFRWIMADDWSNSTYSFVRIATDGSPLVCVANFDREPHEGYRIGLPSAGTWTEVLNTDAQGYGGSGVGNLGSVTAEDVPWQGFPASAVLRVPPLATLWLRVEDGGCHENRVADT